jgi:hypothetical protein
MYAVSKKLACFVAIATVVSISGCQSLPHAEAKPNITFIDTNKFDSDLSASLVAIKNPIEVNFYSPITPNEIPPRLEKWLSMVDKSGGKVNVASPVGEPVPKSPTLILGLFSGLWNAFKIFSGESPAKSMEDAIKTRDANIQLARNAQGNLYIQKITFNERVAK